MSTPPTWYAGNPAGSVMRVPVIGAGGTNVKALATGRRQPCGFAPGPTIRVSDTLVGEQSAAVDAPTERIQTLKHGMPFPISGGARVC